ncbi:MAG: [FeFe] hydrogenase H-cluster radical SAM maturase HydE [Armatimonadetes bacterium]|nr:[FeFe] hydrogenase H-cluster radical SAM maturase HydE [Armatimonadota bacterium]
MPRDLDIPDLASPRLTPADLVPLIRARGEQAEALRDRADHLRRRTVGDSIHLRGIIEFSSYCRCNCEYCGLRADNPSAVRYRLTPDEVLEACEVVSSFGFGTVVLQSGEDPWWTAERLADVIVRIKRDTGLAITLSVGERDEEDYRVWREAGADRYLLRHETADPELYARLHPGASFEARVQCMHVLRGLGYQVGAGSIVGLPGQTWEALGLDLLFMRDMQFHMGSVGPLVPHPGTPLRDEPVGDTQTVLNMMALLRLMIPDIMLPSTTSLETALEGGRLWGLRCGANVIMPNLTPRSVAAKYEIYPGKKAPWITLEDEVGRAMALIRKAGRVAGTGPGHSPRA